MLHMIKVSYVSSFMVVATNFSGFKWKSGWQNEIDITALNLERDI